MCINYARVAAPVYDGKPNLTCIQHSQIASLVYLSENLTEHWSKNNFWKEIHTFADVAICVATIVVAKLAVHDTNTPVLTARFICISIPLTISGLIAVQPGEGIVRRWPVKSYPALVVVTDIAIIHSRVTSQTCAVYRVGQKKLHTVFITITLSTLSQFS